ncbi:glycosyltransferase family 2 protein [Pseudobutyrivibrio xylanivorans]|uniref:Glycosyl transferase family 2 n=1 Tax=Pseudobutyrivibrio xylanivorans TaxID=185007 RepID=A0A1G5S2B0_PSEXY|nr:glycosyltransferase family A protein [Pseudobutyrivibrio xylanivorans]SCZ79709.1 Glycosyl transferase family 2 [Pseudobutyrivibrio xylanivorans]
MSKKISIIIPAYNAQKYIARCLDSIISQIDRQIEVIVINDGSQDDTRVICERYHDNYDFINVVSKENGGVSSARNAGIKMATGDYILFLDADDYLAEGTIKWALDKSEQDVLVCGSFNYIKTRGRIEPCYMDEKTYDVEKDSVDLFIYKIPNAPWGKLYNKNIIVEHDIKFPEGIPYAEDTIFMLEYLKYIRFVRTTNEIIYNYNFTDSGSAMWKYYPDFYKYMKVVMEKKRQLSECKGLEYNESLDRETYYNRCLNHYMKNGKFDCLEEVINAFDVKDTVRSIKKQWYKNNWKSYITYIVKKKILM